MIQKIFQNKLNTFLLVVAGYLLIHFLNFSLTEFIYLVPGAHLVHIPSGFKLLFVLLAGWTGALGVAVATLVACIVYRFPLEYLLGLQLAVMSGLAPFISRRIVIDIYAMNEDLISISVKQLVILGLLFALLNSGLHQAVLYWNGVSQNFLDGFLVSFIGDITGTYIVFLLLKLLSKKFVKLDESETG